MDFLVNIIVHYGDKVTSKRCSTDYCLGELVAFVCSKWPELSRDNIELFYHVRGNGAVLLDEEEDMSSMFCLMLDRNMESMNISVNHIGVELVQSCGSSSNSSVGTKLQIVSVGQRVMEVDDACAQESAFAIGQNLRTEEWRKLIVGVGQVFRGGAVEFRKSLAMYSIALRFEYQTVKNDPSRVTAQCKYKKERGCMWRIHASIEKPEKCFRLRSYERTHTCDVDFGSVGTSRMTTNIVVDLVVNEIRAIRTLSPVQVKMLVKKNYGIDISYTVAWKATDRARALIFGDHSLSFSLLKPYFSELDRTNPGSYHDLDMDEDMRFRRCVFAFAASLDGFKHCRPMLMLDGTFLKGKHKGILLSAVAKDGDEGLFPVAFAIVNEETDDNWAYFLTHLKRAINNENREIVFISDRNHGILQGVRDIFPDSPHGYCYMHLKCNLKDRFRGCRKITKKIILKYFSKCAYAATKSQFAKFVEKFRDAGGDKADDFLADTPKERWANAYFQGQRYGNLTSNAAESWNSQILGVRILPITSLIDGIRSILMKQMCNRRLFASTWRKSLTKSIEEKMIELTELGRAWDVCKSVDFIYEVYSEPRAVVDVKEKTCTCRLWQINGLPCVHAATVIFLNLRGDHTLLDCYFHTEKYRESYAAGIIPFPMPVLEEGYEVISPPVFHQRRGRPQTKRVESIGEKPKKRMKCGNCKEFGFHNKASCRKPPA